MFVPALPDTDLIYRGST